MRTAMTLSNRRRTGEHFRMQKCAGKTRGRDGDGLARMSDIGAFLSEEIELLLHDPIRE
jgi:hypothetical protein